MVPISPTAPLHLIPSPHDRKDYLWENVCRTDEEAPAAVSGLTWLRDLTRSRRFFSKNQKNAARAI
jgi:hypothetical protein